MINGDPDADGISGTTIYCEALTYLGLEYEYDFPIRTKEGHGLQIRIIDIAKKKGIKLIITTDCGSKDYEAIEYAKDKGIDVIITDHHVLGKDKNPALALINPFTIKKPTLFQKLSGGGVSLKFVLTLFKFINQVSSAKFSRQYCFRCKSEQRSVLEPPAFLPAGLQSRLLRHLREPSSAFQKRIVLPAQFHLR